MRDSVFKCRAAGKSDNRCEGCRFFIQHYVRVPFINTDYWETDDGYCIKKRRKHVRSNWVCDGYEKSVRRT